MYPNNRGLTEVAGRVENTHFTSLDTDVRCVIICVESRLCFAAAEEVFPLWVIVLAVSL